MRLFRRPTARFAVQVALPALLIVAAAIFAGHLILNDMADQVDRSETRSVERSVNAALNSFLTRLRETHGDYAVWDDAVRDLYGKVDLAFAESNLADSTRQAILFDTAYLLDENDRSILGYTHGSVAMRAASDEFGQALEVLVAKVRAQSKPYDAETGFLRDRAGAIYAIAVGSVMPSSNAVARPLGRPRLLVLGRSLDGAALQRIGQEFALDGLAFVSSSAPLRPGVRINDPSGNEIATLTWSPSIEGLEAFQRVLPTAFLAVGLICLTMLFLMAIGYFNLVELSKRERQAVFAANHDELTGLSNRAAFSRMLDRATVEHRREETPVALVYMDLDGFKEVNDAYGHASGDFLLKYVASGFASICEGSGTLARVGGDEFALLLDRAETVERAEVLCERFIRFLDQPAAVNGRMVSIGISIGVAVMAQEALSAEELLRRSDVAMYLAKEFGRNRVAFYDRSIDAARSERMALADKLREAIKADQLAVVYQPIFDAGSMQPTGVEALVRWLHPEIGLVPPDIFVPIAEESGLIDQIGAFVIRRACRDALDWPDVRLSVNVSAVQFRNPKFDVALAEMLSEVGFPAERLEIEMTETHLVANPERAQAIIANLRARGVTIALDDFGTGYSSIGYLRRFAFDKLKLDRSLVVGITSDETARELCEATIALARALDLRVTAEGVETEREAALLRMAGCDYLQGYAFARPMTAQAVASFLLSTLPSAFVLPWSG
ncbi:EAL domain-containing protein [Mesorhizobium sp. BR1-1-16]|uniref:putative bifunctional diguanylate cyclase/phosphodiesterase n=1 Tax=Mesorhizobium sp. BR1-1-16 TaxID=2876653 RepID=UPI001CCEFDB4|nr:EAL domain-containing protein [Mesorhizobium sp. BR1-1-16]MBZ9935035.1 EAL domain-containing protein [Mesorhizobium sp. BR1-1-16]